MPLIGTNTEQTEKIEPVRIDRGAELQTLLLESGRLKKRDLKKIRKDVRSNAEMERELSSKAGLEPEEFARFLAEQYDLPYIGTLDASKIDPEAVTLIPQDVARKHSMIPLFEINGRLIVAVASPQTLQILCHLSRRVKRPIDPVLSTQEQIGLAIREFYRDMDEVDTLGIDENDSNEQSESDEIVYHLDDDENKQQDGVVRLVDLILRQAIQDGVSDIHIDPDDDFLFIRFRVAGVLQDVKRLPIQVASGVTSRIKILAGLDIAERRLPQDGRIGVAYNGQEVDLRVSTLPTVIGEKVVMRILDKMKSLVGLDKLGFLSEVREIFNQLINSPYGVFLITGPTGSGKTTTLYAALNAINTREKNFITFEDPVEYRIPGINQVNIIPKAGLTFASGLKASLRQDPDVLLVGEIRDTETAEIVFNAALTGHFVFSTFHTNDAPSTVARLYELSIEPFLIATSVVGINAQRLVRRICDSCITHNMADVSTRRQLGVPDAFSEVRLFSGTGCRQCGGSGYRSQVGIYELMPVMDEIRAMILDRASTDDLLLKAKEYGMLTLWEDGVIKALQGITTIEEVLRVTSDKRG